MDLITNGGFFGYPSVSWFMPIVYGSLGALPALLTLFLDLDRTSDSLRTTNEDPHNIYDFIVGKFLKNSLHAGFKG